MMRKIVKQTQPTPQTIALFKSIEVQFKILARHALAYPKREVYVTDHVRILDGEEAFIHLNTTPETRAFHEGLLAIGDFLKTLETAGIDRLAIVERYDFFSAGSSTLCPYPVTTNSIANIKPDYFDPETFSSGISLTLPCASITLDRIKKAIKIDAAYRADRSQLHGYHHQLHYSVGR